MNKTILITTGASSGIGKETAKLFQSRLECNRYNENPENETG
jgi:NAD(P)-dependent dehydrogenase (short-subunit alcohol dehydrogenase family)